MKPTREDLLAGTDTYSGPWRRNRETGVVTWTAGSTTVEVDVYCRAEGDPEHWVGAPPSAMAQGWPLVGAEAIHARVTGVPGRVCGWLDVARQGDGWVARTDEAVTAVQAVQVIGSAAELARRLLITPHGVNKWLKGAQPSAPLAALMAWVYDCETLGVALDLRAPTVFESLPIETLAEGVRERAARITYGL